MPPVGSPVGFDIAVSSHAVAALTFGLLTVYLLASLKQRGPGMFLVLACAGTAIWAVIHVIDDVVVPIPLYLGLAHTLLDAMWMAFLVSLLCVHWRASGHERLAALAPLVLALGVVSFAGADFLYAVEPMATDWLRHVNYPIYRGLVLSVISLVLIENVYLNTLPANRWSIKFLCFALGGIFAYDFFVYAGGLIEGQINHLLMEARGAVNALVVPLIMISAARNPAWSLDIFFSRRFAVRLVALVTSVIYIFVLLGLGSLVQMVGGAWGIVLETLVLFAGGILLIAILVSGRFRSEIAIFLNKNFFTYKFDYREEWLRFLKTVSKSDEYPDLSVRVIKGVADIADSPGGVLWLHQSDGGFLPTARWNFQQDIVGVEPEDGSLASFLRDTGWIVNLAELDDKPKEYSTFSSPEWLGAIKGAWLVVPLFHQDALSGFIVLLRARAPREINWEDFDLLKTVSTHSVSYLAEQEAEKALVEARQFDAFNRQFAFVIHDIKNLVGQLSLLVSNAEQHGENPEFRRDMISTIHSSVSRLKHMLNRLHGEGERQYPPTLLSLPSLVRRVVERTGKQGVQISCDCDCAEVWVTAYRDRLASVFGHLIQNAIDVLPEDGRIEARVRVEEGSAVVDISDNGPGMSREFVQNELFQPFKTTKPNGYGIGAYEAREIVRGMGGRIEVESAPGQGTRMSVRLPIVSTASNVPGEIRSEESK